MSTTNFESVISARAVGTADVLAQAAAMEKLAASIDGIGRKSEQVKTPKWDQFAASAKGYIEDPLKAAGAAAEGFLKTLGPVGAGVSVAALGFGVLAKAGFEAMKSLGDYAHEMEDAAIKTGLTTKSVAEFGFAAKMNNQDIGIFEKSMRLLSQGIADTGSAGQKTRDAMQKLGVQYQDLHGNVKSSEEIFSQISTGLARMPDVFQRNAAAVALFGRAGIEIVPTLVDLNANVARAQELGLAPKDSDLEQWKEYHRRVVEIDASWDKLVRALKAGVAVPIMWFVGSGTTYHDKALATSVFDAAQVNSDILGDVRRSFYSGLAASGEARLNAPLIAKNDAAVRAARTPDDLDAAKEKLKTDLDALKTGVLPEVNAATLEAIKADREAIKSLEARAKATQELEAAGRSLAAFDRQASEAGMGPVARIFARAGEFAKSPVKGAYDRAMTDAFTLAGPELASEEQQYGGIPAAMDAKSFERQAKQADAAVKEMEGSTSRFVKLFLETVRPMQQATREINDMQYAGERGETAARANQRIRLRELGAGPGDEYRVAQASYAERVSLAQQLYEIDMRRAAAETDANLKRVAEAKAETERHQALFEADLDHEATLAEMRKRGLEEYRGLAVQGFQALVAGGGGWQSLLQSQLMGQASKIVGNGAAMTYRPGALALPGMGTEASPTWLGRVFSGTWFGPQPDKLETAGDKLLVAGTELQVAARALGSGIAGGAGGSGIAGGFSSAAGTFARLFGGSSGGYSPLPGEQASDIHYALDDSGNLVMTGRDVAGGSGSRSTALKGVGYAAGALTAGYGIYAGVKMGGGRGATTAIAAGLGAAAMIPGPQEPFLAAGALIAGFVTTLFGDPKAKRAQELEDEAKARQYTEGVGTQYAVDRGGNSYDYDYRGRQRPIVINNYISAVDTQSFADAVDRNGVEVAQTVYRAVNAGNGAELVGELRQQMALA